MAWPGTEYEYIKDEYCWIVQMENASLALELTIFYRVLHRGGRDIDDLAQVDTVKASGVEIEDRKPCVL